MRTPVPFLIILLLFIANLAPGEEITVRDGISWLEFGDSVDGATVESLFGSQFPGGENFSTAPRLFTANENPALAAWYHQPSGEWRGNLRNLKRGAYWLVLPPGTGQVELILPEVGLRAGVPRSEWGATGWMIRYTASGKLSVEPSTPPKSSATYRVTEKRDSTWKAGSGVYVQDPPDTGLGGYVWVDLAPVEGGYGAKQAAVPIPERGGITVPFLPDFNTPPWGG
ncbi:hypothetical protein KQI52_16230 [bacterium]|nr:hypothetical protein [bacterium]